MAARRRTQFNAAAIAILSTLRPVRLEAEVAGTQLAAFQRKYQSVTGKNPPVSTKSGLLDIGTGKWGAELRVYFNAPAGILAGLRRLGFHVEQGTRWYNGKYRCRINNNSLWWDLIADGFRLGTNR
jgi:hypothetical protein